MSKLRLATVWLDGCSGCHMSVLDIDEKIIELSEKVDLVYSPIADVKEFPTEVDITLVEGAVSSTEDLHKAKIIRERSKLVVSLGDCAITANVPSMRNPWKPSQVLERVYVENATLQQQIPTEVIPALLPKAKPLHEYIKVDAYIPGCPPSADTIWFALTELLAGRMPELTMKTHFGA